MPSDKREIRERVKLVEPNNIDITIIRQCELLSITRDNYYYERSIVRKELDKIEMSLVLVQHSKTPFYGREKISKALMRLGYDISEGQVRRLMKKAGIKALYPKPYLSCPNKQHKKYPYLLSDITASYPNHVWSTDITYIKIPGGHVYLMAMLDLYSRKVLSWEISNTMDTFFCQRVVGAAIKLYGAPYILNTDQGSQFTSEDFTKYVDSKGIKISMDGKGRVFDNIFIERLWRTVKYENIYLNDYQTLPELRAGIKKYFYFYNTERLHQSLEHNTPDEKYFKKEEISTEGATVA